MKPVNATTMSLSTVSPRLLTVVVAVLVAFFYIIAANRTATLGLESHRQEEQLRQERQELSHLQAEIAGKQALSAIADSSLNTQFVAGYNSTAYAQGGSVVVAER
ncbi:MAG: hypothetical protein V1707_03185 [bacterium]